jgi:hypothetical protein
LCIRLDNEIANYPEAPAVIDDESGIR